MALILQVIHIKFTDFASLRPVFVSEKTVGKWTSYYYSSVLDYMPDESGYLSSTNSVEIIVAVRDTRVAFMVEYTAIG